MEEARTEEGTAPGNRSALSLILTLFVVVALGYLCSRPSDSSLGSSQGSQIAPSSFRTPAVLAKPLQTAVGSWYQVVNLSSNAFHSWRDDYVGSYLDQILEASGLLANSMPFPSEGSQAPSALPPLAPQPLYWGHVAILLLGFYALLGRACPPVGCPERILLSLSLGGTFYFLFGANPIICSALSWFPATVLLLVGLRSQRRLNPSMLIFTLFVSLRIAGSANQFGVLLVVLATLSAGALARGESQTRASFWRAHFLLPLLVLAAPSVWVLFTAPLPDLPSYPQTAMVVPSTGLSGITYPRIGPDLLIPCIDRIGVKELLLPSATIFTLLAFFLLVSTPQLSHWERGLFRWNLFLALALLGDVAAPEDVAQLLPLATVGRLLPQVSFLDLSTLLAGAALLVAGLALILHPRRILAAPVLLAVALTSALFCPEPFGVSPGVLSKRNAGRAYQSFIQARITGGLTTVDAEQFYSVLASPSYSVVNNLGLWSLYERRRLERLKSRRIPPTEFFAAGSTHPRQNVSERLMDRDGQTRWSTANGLQRGNEWLYLRFQDFQTLDSIKLLTGLYTTDFPRGVRVLGGNNCPEFYAPPARGKFETLFEALPWRGPLLYTDEGFPYFFFPEVVAIPLRHQATVRCVVIEQIGATTEYDWSVAEVRLQQSRPRNEQESAPSLDPDERQRDNPLYEYERRE